MSALGVENAAEVIKSPFKMQAFFFAGFRIGPAGGMRIPLRP